MRQTLVHSLSLFVVVALVLIGVTPAVAQIPIAVSAPGNVMTFTGTAGAGGVVNPQSLFIMPPPNSVTITSNQAWLTAVPQPSNPLLYEVRVNPATLPAGLSTGILTVSTQVAGYTSTNVTVNVTLTGTGGGSGPALAPSTLAFTYTGTQPLDQTSSLSVNPPVGFSYALLQATYNPASSQWLQYLSPTLANVAANTSAPLTFRVNAGGLGAGQYSATVPIQVNTSGQPGGPTTTINLTVTLSVGQAGSGAALTPSTLAFSYTGTQPLDQTTSLSVNPAVAFSYAVLQPTYNPASTQWLQLISGSLVNVPANTSAPLTFRVNPGGLGAGQYSATVPIQVNTSGLAGGPTTTINLTVNLSVGQAGSGPALTPSTLTFSYNGTQPQDQTTSLSVNPSVAFSYAVLQPTYNPASTQWLQLIGASLVNVPANTSAPLTFRVNPGGLGAGQYSATVPIQVNTSGLAGGPTTTINLTVNLSVGQAGSGATLTPASLTFNVPSAGAQVLNQSVSISISQSVGYTAFQGSTSYTPLLNSGWLQPQQSQLTGAAGQPVVFAYNVSTFGLSNGQYMANTTIQILPNFGSPFTVTLPVTLNVGQGGGGTGAALTPASLTFSYQSGGSLPSAQATTLSYGQNVGYTYSIGTPAYSPQPAASWLQTLSTVSQTVSAGQQVQLLFNAVPTSLANGQYTATVPITVTPTNGTATVVNLMVTFNVGQVATSSLQPTPAQLTFNFQQGGAAPGIQVVTVNPLQAGSASFSASATTTTGTGWLTVNPASGSAPGIVTVSVNPQNLTAGSYQGSILLTSGSASSSIPVVLNVSPNALFKLSPNYLVFYYTAGISNPPGLVQNLNIESTAGTSQPISFTANASSNLSWLFLSNANQPLQTSYQMGVGVSASVASTLASGTYTGTVNVTNTATGVIVSYPVTLVVSTQATLLSAAPASLSFSVTASSGIPAAQTFTVGSSSSGSPLFFTPSVTYVSGANWLTIPTTQGVTGQASGTISVSVNPTGLADGVYAAYIGISAPGTAGNTPLLVPVVLTVGGTGSGGGSFGVTPTALTFNQSQGSAAPPAQTLTVNGPSLPFLATVSNATTTSGITWLTVNPTGGTTPTTLTVSVANSTSLPQGAYNAFIVVTATGTVNTQVIQVTLNVTAPNSLNLSPAVMAFTASISGAAVVNPTNQTLTLSSTLPGLAFTVTPTVQSGTTNWLSVTPNTGTTTSTPSTLTVSVNATGLAAGNYNGSITVSAPGATNSPSIPVTLTVSQVNPPFISSVANSASFATGNIAAGEIVSILGSNLGPANGVGLRLTAAGTVDTTLSGIRVTFSGLPSPLLFVRSDIINAIVPYSLAGRLNTRMVVENNGVQSQPIDLAMQSTAPGIYNLSLTGTGPNWAQNFPDFSVNSPNNSIPRGGAVIFYATGEGQTNPQGADGVISTATLLRRPVATVTAKVGGVDAQVYYAGSIPTLVLGVMQVTVIVPNNAPTGTSVPVEISVGGIVTQAGVTLSIR